jgi:hypothetical protein
LADNLIWLSEQTGKRYVRTDKSTKREPHVGSPAQPWHIPIKGQFGKTSGVLGTTKVTLDDSTVRQVVYPQRGGAHNPKALKFEPPSYYENGVLHYKAFCSRCADKHKDVMEGWKRRSEFYVDRTRGEGKERLQRYCKDCMKDAVVDSRLKKRLAVA